MTVKERLLFAALLIAVVGIFGAALPIAAWRGGITPDTLARVGAVVLSWPVAVLVLGLVFFSRFQSAFDRLLRNVGKMKFPGGIEIEAQAQERPDELPPVAEDRIVLTQEESAQIQQLFTELEHTNRLTAADKQRIEELHRQAELEALRWKFRYLDLFLVEKTKRVLYWVAGQQSVERTEYHRLFATGIPDANEREIILNVLVGNGLLDARGIRLQITQEGYVFLQFIGYLPWAPAESLPRDG